MVINELKFDLADLANIKAFSRRMNDELSSGEIGYYHLPDLGLAAVPSVEELLKTSPEFDAVVLIGVGGSSLGVKAIFEILRPKTQIIFLDNLDPFEISNSLKNLKFERTLFILASKSGTTIESISIYKFVREFFGVKAKFENLIAITEHGSPLETYAKTQNARVFNIHKNVGGRFSVLSNMGLIPLGLSGANIEGLLSGAAACKARFLDGSDTILQKAYHYATHKNAKINVLFSYSSRLRSFNDWYVQLWAESLGKKRGYKRVGLTPVGLIGSKDQHSFLQLIMEGVKDKTVTFITVNNHESDILVPNLSLAGLEECDYTNGFEMGRILNAQAKATMQALLSEKISCDSLNLEILDAWHVGFLIYYYELLTSATGIMMGINTYDQPGVEVGKRILKTLLGGGFLSR